MSEITERWSKPFPVIIQGVERTATGKHDIRGFLTFHGLNPEDWRKYRDGTPTFMWKDGDLPCQM